MACEDIENQLLALRRQKRDLNQGIANLQGAELLSAQKNLAKLEGQIAVEKVHLENCRAVEQQENEPTPRPFVAYVKNIFCSEANKEIGRDEPYLLITTVDMLRIVQVAIDPLPAGLVPPVRIPAVHCFKVGPWSGVKPATWHPASELAAINNPRFWDLSGIAKTVASPQDLIFVIGVFENDSSSPESIRQVLEPAMEITLAMNLGLTYSALADTLVNDMKGTFDTARLLGLAPALLPDDRIGVMRLNLTTTDLDTINALGKHEKSLTFMQKNSSGKVTNEYTVTFSFESSSVA